MPQPHLAVVKTLAPEDPPAPTCMLVLGWPDADALLRLADLADDLDIDERHARESLRSFVWAARCQLDCIACGAELGTPHLPACRVARCWWTGLRRVDCDHAHPTAGPAQGGLFDDEQLRCGLDAWTGEHPGVAECRALDWWCYRDGDATVRCVDHHPDARPDLARLVADGVWDRAARRWTGARDDENVAVR